MIDNRASHNFIPHSLVDCLGIVATPSLSFSICIGDGYYGPTGAYVPISAYWGGNVDSLMKNKILPFTSSRTPRLSMEPHQRSPHSPPSNVTPRPPESIEEVFLRVNRVLTLNRPTASHGTGTSLEPHWGRTYRRRCAETSAPKDTDMKPVIGFSEALQVQRIVLPAGKISHDQILKGEETPKKKRRKRKELHVRDLGANDGNADDHPLFLQDAGEFRQKGHLSSKLQQALSYKHFIASIQQKIVTEMIQLFELLKAKSAEVQVGPFKGPIAARVSSSRRTCNSLPTFQLSTKGGSDSPPDLTIEFHSSPKIFIR
ncbi:hypothetical protein KSP40_PGU021059 [Platanthera guangdongensis]|uniref:Ribosomal protein S3 n=1 Tax=Platanthera guangdongensis TaxID=2320717 RepID=A0ABR2LT48_9ASPA